MSVPLIEFSEPCPSKGPRLRHNRRTRSLAYEYKGRVFDYCEVTARFVGREGAGLITTDAARNFVTPDGLVYPHADWAIQAYVDRKEQAQAIPRAESAATSMEAQNA